MLTSYRDDSNDTPHLELIPVEGLSHTWQVRIFCLTGTKPNSGRGREIWCCILPYHGG